MKVLKENAQNRDKMREAGMTLQLFKTLIKTKAAKPRELFKTMNGDEEDGERSEENRLMGFGEYHHWAYGNVLTEKPNYVTYVCAGGGRSSEAQKHSQEWIKLKEDRIEQEVLASSNEHEARPEVKDLGMTYSGLQRMMDGDPIALEEQRLRNERSRRTCLQSGKNSDS